ncbi:hypothetical protein [Haloarchaeobius sp. TZWWS8]|uniref:hypothetical protein n=1 Tax=Haloarchaeobius sp. TZWWS8 TaxID=3446121 RepID=UPI003EB6F660
MRLSRRRVLQAGTLLGISAVPGCFSGERPLTVTLLNFTDEPQRLAVELLRMDADERSDALVLDRLYELDPRPAGGAASELKKRDVVTSRRYFVRVQLDDDRSVTGTYRFFPDCTERDEPPEELYVKINRDGDDDEPYIGFQQSACGGEAGWF